MDRHWISWKNSFTPASARRSDAPLPGSSSGKTAGSFGVKLLSWNIRRAGKRTRDGIIEALVRHAPDVAVLVDPPVGRRFDRLVEALEGAGFRVVCPQTDEPARVVIATRTKVRQTAPSTRDLELRDRWVEVVVPGHELRVAGVARGAYRGGVGSFGPSRGL